MIDVKTDAQPDDLIYAERNFQACTLKVSAIVEAAANAGAGATELSQWMGADENHAYIDINGENPDPEGWGALLAVNAQGGNSKALLNAWVDEGLNKGKADLILVGTVASNREVRISSNALTETCDWFIDSALTLKMQGFDVIASDTAARLTVDSIEYSVAKAVKVKIGNDTFFWPLFGPVAP